MADQVASCDSRLIAMIALPTSGGTEPAGWPSLTAALQNTNCSVPTGTGSRTFVPTALGAAARPSRH